MNDDERELVEVFDRLRSSGLTVPQRLRILGYTEMTGYQRFATACGNAVRERWLDRTGHLPYKDLQQKTAGSGSHCHAIYPASWLELIDDTIAQIAKVTPGAARSAEASRHRLELEAIVNVDEVWA